MKTIYNSNSPLGCTVVSLDQSACLGLIEAIRAGRRPERFGQEKGWLLAHCNDGVVWGRAESGQDRLHLSSDVFPEVSPTILVESLQTLRLFDTIGEFLIWRDNDEFRGRHVQDAPGPDKRSEPVRRSLCLLGTRVIEIRQGFTLLEDSGGSRHAPPLSIPKVLRRGDAGRLGVVEYLAQNNATGELRIALSRLSTLEQGEVK